MALAGTLRPFGLREITVKRSGAPVKLPAAMTLSFKEVLNSGEMHGNDATQAVVAVADKVEWSLESGGISLEAFTEMTGRAIVLSGTGTTEVNTMTARAGDIYPYFEIRGRSVGDDSGDIHVILPKCKLTDGMQGEFKDGEFFVTSCSGIAVDDGTALYQLVQNETAAALPTS